MVNRINAAKTFADQRSTESDPSPASELGITSKAREQSSDGLDASQRSDVQPNLSVLEKIAGDSNFQLKRRPFLMQWFYNLPIGRKQTLALIACELMPLIGLGMGSAIVLIHSLRTQLREQAAAEVAVTETHYNTKVNQMGVDSRGQSDNIAIINAAKAWKTGAVPTADLQSQVKQILKNEVKARKLEYATLVGKDLRIVVNANADRQGETFNPDGLVSDVLKTSQQIKASGIVTQSELTQEGASLPAGAANQDALIRYVVTPVKNPATNETIGALVFGDVVNQKLSIAEATLRSLGNGYSAVYLRKSNGEFALATGLNQNANSSDSQRNIPLPNTSLLAAATAERGKAVTDRMTISGLPYTVAAKAVPNQTTETPDGPNSTFSKEPAAILVRGTSEARLSSLLQSGLVQEAIVLGLGLAAILMWLRVFRSAVLKPLKHLEKATQEFAEGDRQARAQVTSLDEIGQLSLTFNSMATTIAEAETILGEAAKSYERQSKQADLLNKVITRIRQTLDFERVLQTGVDEIRDFLNVDRVLIYTFNQGWGSGKITAESVGAGWLKVLGQTIEDPLVEGAIDRYNSGRIWYTNDIHKDNLSHCHCQILERLQVKANIVAPIKMNGELIGLLCAHQCASARDWQPSEIDLFGQLAAQIGYALDQADLLKQQKEATQLARQLNEMTVRLRESLDREQIYSVVVRELRTTLTVDRTVVYLFDDQWQGSVVAESVGQGWTPALGATIADPCFAQAYIEKYKRGRVQALSDIYEADLDRCYLGQLEPFEVRANVVAPILVNETLLGLLVVHQCSGPRDWQEAEVNLIRQIAIQLGFALEQATLLKEQQEQAKFDRQLHEVTLNIRQTLAPETILSVAVQETRRALQADRVVIYLFNPDFTGTVRAESVGRCKSILGETVTDPFREGLIDEYRDGRVRVMHDVYSEELTHCHLGILETFEIRASITAPILEGDRLLGLICVHQCSGPREWRDAEATFFKQASRQVGFALEQATLLEQREQARLQAEMISQDQRQQKEVLQMQLVELLSDVEGASRGDLTVRAEVTAGDIGTVADFFNSIVESLRQLVTQVKQSALQVNAALGENDGAIRQLADEAMKQAEETALTLQSVEDMTHSIRAVADSASLAAQVTRTASTTAQSGGVAMDLTVQNILSLRETIGETAKKVKRLGESSQKISKVVSLINQIALQTNLLAINAGIEAARAGEDGQGFAVVAEEVGELAARSAAATQEIEQIVENIQRETNEVVEAMEQGTAQVVEGTHLVENAKESLEQILDVSRQIDQLVQSISDATVSQVQTSQTISHLMEEVASIAGRTSNSSRQVSKSLRETVEIAHELQASVGTFKVS